MRVGSHPPHLWERLKTEVIGGWQRKPGCPAPWWDGWTWKNCYSRSRRITTGQFRFQRCYFCCREGTWLQMTSKIWMSVPAVTSMQSSNILGGSFNEMISLLKEKIFPRSGETQKKRQTQTIITIFKSLLHEHFPSQIPLFYHTLPFQPEERVTPIQKATVNLGSWATGRGMGGSLLVNKNLYLDLFCCGVGV